METDDKNPKETPELNTSVQQLRNLRDQYESTDLKIKHPIISGLLSGLTQIVEVQAERQASKTPQQRAEEAQRWAENDRLNKINKLKKKNEELDILYRPWLKLDTWLIYDEAMPLLKGEKPEEDSIWFTKDPILWKTVGSCAGHSLSVINLGEDSKKWRVKPSEWIRWLIEKGYQVPNQLLCLLPKSVATKSNAKTYAANLSKDLKKKERLKALKIFMADIGERTRKANLNWDPQKISVTKKEFLAVFFKQHPQIGVIGLETFSNDITHIGVKFASGTKTNKNNVLNMIYA